MAVDLVFGVEGGYVVPGGGAVHLVLGPPAGGSGATTNATIALGLKLVLAANVAAAAPLPGPSIVQPWQHTSFVPGGHASQPWGRTQAQPGTFGRQPWDRLAQSLVGTLAAQPWDAAQPFWNGWRQPWNAAAPFWDKWAQKWNAAGTAAGAWVQPWGAAAPRPAQLRQPWQSSSGIGRSLLQPWDAALNLPAPREPLPFVYVPPPGAERLVHLHFCRPAPGSLDLVLGVDPCEGVLAPPASGSIPDQDVYMSAHTISAVRLPDGTPFTLTAFSLAADADSVAWELQAEGSPDLLTFLAPTSGVPARMRLVADGLTWEFVVEGLRRNRQASGRTASITARSASVLLADPYYPPATYLNGAPMTAQQVLEDVLQFTGIGLDWRCTDWLVPAGAWSFSGTPLAAVRRVADSIGALVQSPRTGDSIIVAPRYPALPWAWGTTTPDVIVSASAITLEGYERADQPAYDGVYVSGRSQGVLALVKRTGSAPSTLIPLVTDELVTHLDAARQRGSALLGKAGPGANVDRTLPVLTGAGEPGVIDVGTLVRVDEGATSVKGLVRAVRVTYQAGVLRQTLTMEQRG